MTSHAASFTLSLVFAIFTQTACDPPKPAVRAEVSHIDEFAPPEFVPPEPKSNPADRPEHQEPAEAEPEPPSQEHPIDLNTADARELQRLPGVGPSTASRILSYREKRLFERKRHLKRVPGIGPRTYEKLAPLVKVE